MIIGITGSKPMNANKYRVALSNIIAMSILVVATIPLAFVLVDRLEASITPITTSNNPPLVFAYGRLIDNKLVIVVCSEHSVLEKSSLNIIFSNNSIAPLKEVASSIYMPSSDRLVAVLSLRDVGNLPIAIELVLPNGDRYAYRILY